MISEEWLDHPDMLDKAQDLLDMGLIDDAQDILDQHRDSFKCYWEFYFLYARVYTDRNMPREAVPCLLQGLRLERDNADCLVGLFYAFAMMNRVKRGGGFLLRAEEVHPDNDLVQSALIWYYTEMNLPEKAIESFERANAIDSSNPETYRNGGLAFSRLGRFDEAEECYKTALSLAPDFEEARDLLADHLINGGKVDEAVDLYENGLRESPQNIRYISKLIYCLSQKGDFDKAAFWATRLKDLYPNSPVGYIDLAYVRLNTNRMEEAAENADMAISVAPIDPEAYKVKAIALSELGEFEEAEELFEKAASLDPENPDILRDYYHHLRIAGKYDLMAEVVNEVIRIEYPYCTEDYWFMAEFYRDLNDNLKAFRYLRLAYDTMPAEKELLPPMIEILLEQGHTQYCLPIFADYVCRSGWTDSMSHFVMNKQFKDRQTQEGMRFLRFATERPMKYRKYIFNYYLYRFGLIYYTIIATALLFPASALLGWRGAGWVAAGYAVSMCALKIVNIIRFRMAVARAARSIQPIPAKGPA